MSNRIKVGDRVLHEVSKSLGTVEAVLMHRSGPRVRVLWDFSGYSGLVNQGYLRIVKDVK